MRKLTFYIFYYKFTRIKLEYTILGVRKKRSSF